MRTLLAIVVYAIVFGCGEPEKVSFRKSAAPKTTAAITPEERNAAIGELLKLAPQIQKTGANSQVDPRAVETEREVPEVNCAVSADSLEPEIAKLHAKVCKSELQLLLQNGNSGRSCNWNSDCAPSGYCLWSGSSGRCVDSCASGTYCGITGGSVPPGSHLCCNANQVCGGSVNQMQCKCSTSPCTVSGQSRNTTTCECQCPETAPEIYNNTCVAACTAGKINLPPDGRCGCDPSTKVEFNGSCVNICSGGKINLPPDGRCGCNEELQDEYNGRCVDKCTGGKTHQPPDGACQCNSQTEDDFNGNCLAKCTGGKQRNTSTGACECPAELPDFWNGNCVAACTGGKQRNPTTGACECPQGTEELNGSCQNQCPAGTSRCFDGECRTTSECNCLGMGGTPESCTGSCTGGQVRDPITGQCQCPSGTVMENGQCQVPCGPGQVRKADGSCGCPEGQDLVNGSCISQCAVGQIRDQNGTCVSPACCFTYGPPPGYFWSSGASCPSGSDAALPGDCIGAPSPSLTPVPNGKCESDSQPSQEGPAPICVSTDE